MIGERIKSARKAAGFTQKELANLVKVTQTAVSKWESDTDQPKGGNLDTLSKVLKTSSEWILHGKGDSHLNPMIRESSATYETRSIAFTLLFDRDNAAKHLKGEEADILKNISSIAVPEKMRSQSVFAMVEDMDGMAPLINKNDYVFIKSDLPLKSDTNSAFWVNNKPIIGHVKETPMGITLHFITSTPGWEPIKVAHKDYIGRVIAIDPVWAREQRDK